MLFHITQTHTPEHCPLQTGGSKTLYDAKAPGVKLLGVFGAFPQHTIFYLVEAESVDALQKFLEPGFLRCTSWITPVSGEPMAAPARGRRRPAK